MGIIARVDNLIKEKRGRVFGIVDIYYRKKEYRKRAGEDRYSKIILDLYEACVSKKEEDVNELKEMLAQPDLLVLPRVAISLSNRCSLRCRDCNNLIPYAAEKYDRPVAEQIKDLEKLLKVADRICNVELIGGEPFLYRNLPDVLAFVLKSSQIDQVEITTNGTIMPSEELIRLLRNDKLVVVFSDYGNINKKSEIIREKLISAGIQVTNLRNDKWYNAGGMEKRGKSIERIRYEFAMCECKDVCRTLYRGKLYVCGRAPILHELGKLSSHIDFLELDKLPEDKTGAKRIIKRFFCNKYAESCDFCDYASDSVKYVPSGIQLERRKGNYEN